VTFAEVFAGIRGASVAWDALDWQCLWVAETDAFASAVGAYHHGAPNLGDVHEVGKDTAEPVDILIGGPPCQDFSLAGKREGMAGSRGSMVWQYLRVADELCPRWLVFENVPGLLSSGSGRDFGAFLGALAERGYMGCYRVLDAQFAGVPQRRRRVFAVCHLGDWRPAAAVLLERESLCWNPAPSREAREEVAGSLTGGTRKCGGADENDAEQRRLVPSLTGGPPFARTGNSRVEAEALVAFSCKDNGRDAGNLSPPLRAMGHDRSHTNAGGQVAVAFDTQQITSKTNRTRAEDGLPASSLAARSRMHIAFAQNRVGEVRTGEVVGTLNENSNASGRNTRMVVGPLCANAATERKHGDGGISSIQQFLSGHIQPAGFGVRRLTPRECERLQGFPDDYTLIPWRGKPREQCPDGPRYRVLGNAFPVPVVRWIGERIVLAEARLAAAREQGRLM